MGRQPCDPHGTSGRGRERRHPVGGVALQVADHVGHVGQHGARGGTRRLALGGLGCLLLAVPLAYLPGVKGVPLPGYLASLLLFAGFALLAPWMLQQAGRWLHGRALELLVPVEYRLLEG